MSSNIFNFFTSILGSFFGIGLYEKYFKGYSILFWDYTERKLLQSILNIMDYKMPEILSSKNPAEKLFLEFNFATAISTYNLKLPSISDTTKLFSKFQKVYDPHINAIKLQQTEEITHASNNN